jgi:hypothetical protein
MRLLVSAAVVFAASSALAAGLGPIPGEERFGQSQMGGENQNSGGAEVGWTKIGDQHFLQITPRLDLNLGMVGLGLQIPLNLYLPPEEPWVREEDYDESPQDYFKLIRYLRIGNKGDTFYGRVGELAAELGHGTIMSRYINNFDLNTRRVGLVLDVNTNYGGIESVISDIGALTTDTVDSKLIGARLYLKPFALVDPESFLNIIQIGVTTVSDTNAPYEIDTTSTSDEVAVSRQDYATVGGFDIGIELLRSSMLDVTPYTDVNFIEGAGWGWHLGIAALAKLPIGFDFSIPVRLEYRRFKENYAPAYFSTFYELERFSYPLGGAASVPKFRFIDEVAEGDGLNGFYGDAAFDFAGILQVGAVYEGYDHADSTLGVFLAVPALEWLQFKAYYARNGITGTNDIFVLDDRSLVIAQARYELFSYTYLVGRWSRQWVYNPETDAHESEDTYNVGLEFGFSF